MSNLDTSWFHVASRRMDWLAARQQAIAENVANADTPGYVGRDVSSFADHLERAGDLDDRSVDVGEATNAWGGSFDGNHVVLEEQALLSATTSGEFKLASRLYRMGRDLIGLASGKR